MKIFLTAINAKYIHSNLGIYSLKAYGEKMLAEQGFKREQIQIELAEYTINHQLEQILKDLYCRKPDVIGFSCYIWNISYIKCLLADIKKVLPEVKIWLGGPEVSYCGEEILREQPVVDLVMKGEGEETFAQLLQVLVEKEGSGASFSGYLEEIKQKGIPGLVFLDSQGNKDGAAWGTFAGGDRQAGWPVYDTGIRPPMDMNRIPFPYGFLEMEQLEHRIIYYESSRGCPFSCAYCLSSIDKSVRFRSLERVKEELSFFLNARVPQVKFVDRTFNAKKSHAMAIWKHILEHDNGVTNFHFEITADLLDEEELELISRMRPGLIQLEIGVQSTNTETIRAIRRKMDLKRLRYVVERINAGKNVHQHLDLIAGLPFEDYESFGRSFNEVYSMEPEQFQLGFLKVLKGSYMHDMVEEYGLKYRGKAPYEVLSTKWLPYSDVLRLKGVEDMVEVYYNSRQFLRTLKLFEQEFESAFAMYEYMAQYYDEQHLTGLNHSRLARYEIFHDLIGQKVEPEQMGAFEDALMCDLYFRENAKSRPSFALPQAPYKEELRRMVPELRTLGIQVHAEVLRSGEVLLFDYREKDRLNHNAKLTVLGRIEA